MKNFMNKFQSLKAAYPGDVHYKVLKKSEIKSSTMKIGAIATIIFCLIIDYINIGQLWQLQMDIPTSVLQNPFSDIFTYLKPNILALVMTAFLAICSVFLGTLFRHAQNDGLNGAKIFGMVFCALVILAIVVGVTYFRFTSEIRQINGDIEALSYDPVALSVVYTVFMIGGVVVSLLYGFFGRDYRREAYTKSEFDHLEKEIVKYKTEPLKRAEVELKNGKFYERKRKIEHDINKHFSYLDVLVAKMRTVSDPEEFKILDESFKKAKEMYSFE